MEKLYTENPLLNNLNTPQKEAVQAINEPVLVLAGAGSGKTRVITRRLAYILATTDTPPWGILCVTFTNKAAGEMKERVKELVGEQSLNGIWVTTFHSACAKFLRREIEVLGLPQNFTILDTQDQKTLMKNCLESLNLPLDKYKPQVFLGRISKMKTKLIYPTQAKEMGEFKGLGSRSDDFRLLVKLYELYQDQLWENAALDFDDLLGFTVHILENHEDVREKYQNQFRHILVDEYQDTNMAQYKIVNALAPPQNLICVVGDDDQSIYRWRGADVGNILKFQEDYPGAKVIKLEENYRSTENILSAAQSVVAQNKKRMKKNLFTNHESGEKIGLISATDSYDEAFQVVKQIKKGIDAGKWEPGDVAVFYRTNAQSREFEEQFMSSQIPYHIVGNIRFYERKEIKDLIAFLRLVENPSDNLAFRRVINTPPRGIGKTSLLKMEELAKANKEPFLKTSANLSSYGGFRPAALSSFKQFTTMVGQWIHKKKELAPSKLLLQIIEATGYGDFVQNQDESQLKERWENVAELCKALEEFENDFASQEQNEEDPQQTALSAFLEWVTLISDIDQSPDKSDFVMLMTLHSAKGLEFPVVFLTGFEEGIMPHQFNKDDPVGREEERRLCYVGITRAKKKLFISYAYSRMVFGRTEMKGPSPFLQEIPNRLIESLIQAPAPTRRKKGGVVSKNFQGGGGNLLTKPTDLLSTRKAPIFGVGDRVRHRKYGIGKVMMTDGSGERLNVQVDFDRFGVKILRQKMANLIKV